MNPKLRYKFVAKSVIINQEGKILALTRSATDTASPGRIDLPGGGVDENETYAVAAAREIAEEVGLSVIPQQLHFAYSMTRMEPEMQAVIVRFLFLTHVDTDVIILSYEHDSYTWYDPIAFQAAFAETTWGEAVNFLAAHGMLK